MRFSEYVNRSKSRRSLHEDELKDSSYYVDSNGFVTSNIADKIKLSDVAKKMYNDIKKQDVTYSVEKALNNDIKNFGNVYNGGIDAFVNEIYHWARFGKSYRYPGCEDADIQALAIILANDWYESRKAKLNLKENCKKALKESELHEGALKDDSKYVNSNGFVTSDIVKDIKLSDDGDELYNFIMNDENTYNDVVTKTSEHLDNYFKKYGDLFHGGINSFKKAVFREKDSYPYGRLKVKKSDIQAIAIILANDWYESRKKKLNLKENCKKALKESKTYDDDFYEYWR